MTAPAVLERPPETTEKRDDGAETAEPCIIQEWGQYGLIEHHLADKFLEVCQKSAIRTTRWTYCPPDCEGHPTCQACYTLGVHEGVIK